MRGLRLPRTLLGSLLVFLALLLAYSATAVADGSLTPVVDCVVPLGSNAIATKVYFGYVNTGVQVAVAFGDSNEVAPGLQFQGQPTVFNTGTYERVFSAVWDEAAFQGIEWVLNGVAAIADSTTPLCLAGSTGTASDLTTGTATLHGDVNFGGQATTYHFEYGNGNGPDLSTPTETVPAGPQQTVSEPIADLTPGTSYHFRIVATNSDETTQGALATFVTATPPPAAVTTTVTVQTPTVTVAGPTTTVTTPVLTPTAAGTLKLKITTGAVSAHALARGASRCTLPVVAGVTVTTNQSAHLRVIASASGVIAAQGATATAGQPVALVLCLNRHGRELVSAQGQRFRSLAATLAVQATSGARRAVTTVHTVFRRP